MRIHLFPNKVSVTLPYLLLVLLTIITFLEISVDFQPWTSKGLSIKNGFFYIFIILVLGQLKFKGDDWKFIRIEQVILPYTIFLTWGFMSVLYADPLYAPPTGSFTTFKNDILDYFLVFLFFFYFIDCKQDAYNLIVFFCVLFIIGAAITLFDATNSGMAIFGFDNEELKLRPNGPMGEANMSAAIFSFFIPIMLSMGISRFINRYFATIGTLLMVIALLLTNSRGGMLGSVIGCSILFWRLKKYLHIGNKIKLLILLIFVLFFAWVVLPESIKGLFLQRWSFFQGVQMIDYEYASAGRTEFWKIGFRAWTETPICGIGWGAFQGKTGHTSHNTYLEILLEAGAIGFLIYAWLIRNIFSTLQQNISRIQEMDKIFIYGIMAGLVGLLTSLFFVNLYNPSFFIWAFLGVSFSYIVQAHKDFRKDSNHFQKHK